MNNTFGKILIGVGQDSLYVHLDKTDFYDKIIHRVLTILGVVQMARTPESGSGGRGFKSHRPDQYCMTLSATGKTVALFNF